MTNEQQNLIKDTQAGLRQLLKQYMRQQQQLQAAKDVITQKEAEIKALQNELRTQKQQMATLKIAKTMELTEKDTKEAHNRLTRLIRQVDECMALLQAK